VGSKKEKIITGILSMVAICTIGFFICTYFSTKGEPSSLGADSGEGAPLVIAGTIATSVNSVEWSLPGQTITLLVSSTSADQEQGLGDTPSLSSTTGMFFVFAEPDDYGFWMKDMKFPLDIIWLDQNFKIIHIEHDLSSTTYPKVFLPDSPAKYVIEVNAGLAQKFSLAIGETMQIYQK
jgi:uncharacterized membrane protein (UPF0127 family)